MLLPQMLFPLSPQTFLYFVSPNHPNISISRRPFTEAEFRTEFVWFGFFFPTWTLANLLFLPTHDEFRDLHRREANFTCIALASDTMTQTQALPAWLCHHGSCPCAHFNDISEREKERGGFWGDKNCQLIETIFN